MPILHNLRINKWVTSSITFLSITMLFIIVGVGKQHQKTLH